LLQQDPIFAPSLFAPCVSLVPPEPAPAPPSPSLGSFLAIAKNMSLTLRAVLADVSMNNKPFSSAYAEASSYSTEMQKVKKYSIERNLQNTLIKIP
jgi:hypothetical protein